MVLLTSAFDKAPNPVLILPQESKSVLSRRHMASIRAAIPVAGQKGLRTGRTRFPCGILSVDSRNQLSIITEAAAQILTSPPGKAPVTLESLPQALQKMVAQVRASRRAKTDLQIKIPGGKIFQVSVFPANSRKNDSSVVIVVQDLTSERMFEQSLRHNERLASLGMLSAGMAHEIKNTLVVGKTFFDLLLEKHQDAELVELARRELARIDSLVSQMLRFTGQSKPDFGQLHVHDLLDHSLRLVNYQLKVKSIQLERSYAASSDLVRGDDCQLEQVFVNLLLNAVDALAPHGRLTVSTSALNPPPRSGRSGSAIRPHLCVIIQDNGIGIPPENIDHLFGPFFTTKNGGTGLGLSITRRIIEDHGGSIAVESKPDEGAAFQILLPSFDEVVVRA